MELASRDIVQQKGTRKLLTWGLVALVRLVLAVVALLVQPNVPADAIRALDVDVHFLLERECEHCFQGRVHLGHELRVDAMVHEVEESRVLRGRPHLRRHLLGGLGEVDDRELLRCHGHEVYPTPKIVYELRSDAGSGIGWTQIGAQMRMVKQRLF